MCGFLRRLIRSSFIKRKGGGLFVGVFFVMVWRRESLWVRLFLVFFIEEIGFDVVFYGEWL